MERRLVFSIVGGLITILGLYLVLLGAFTFIKCGGSSVLLLVGGVVFGLYGGWIFSNRVQGEGHS